MAALSTDEVDEACGIDYYQAVYSNLCSARKINLKETNYGK